jgi:UDP-N-acetylmuramoyl-tripeptide--D-alanyl-D-alanine ligase
MIEMGMNHPGEIAELTRIADPDVVGCTMVGRGHLEGLGSIEGVARGKAEIYESARPDALFIFNADNPYTREMLREALARNPRQRLLRFGAPSMVAGGAVADRNASAGSDFAANAVSDLAASGRGLDVCLRVERATEAAIVVSGHIGGEAGRAEVPVFGAHNVVNVMAASCFALAAGLAPSQIWQALPLCKAAWGRNQWVDLKSGARALFDAYNANPESMGAAIDNFARLAATGRKLAVLGEMRELGASSAVAHEELGRLVAGAGFEAVAFIGADVVAADATGSAASSGANASASPGAVTGAAAATAFKAGLERGGFRKKQVIMNTYEQSLAREMASVLKSNDIVLFKGSRGVRLERALRDFEPLNFAAKG